jgi:predicted small lipoprotein YifL
MKKFLTTIIISCMMLALAGCGGGPVGYWMIDKVVAGDVTMTQEDASSIGMATVGAIKLQKSGNCVVELLGNEYEGTWTQDDDGTLTVTYKYDTEDLVLTGSIDDEGIMVLKDDQGQEYYLSK